MQKLLVIYAGWGERWTLGTLAAHQRTVLFEYSPEALQRGLELSPRHLKLRLAAYGDFPSFQFGLPGLIADCLPDGWGQLLMDRFFKRYWRRDAYQVTALDRLAFLGSRAMGALVFEPEQGDLIQEDLDLLSLAKNIRNVVDDQAELALKQLVLVGGSPQGARPKAVVRYDPASARLSTLDNAPGTDWLVKFPARGEHAEVCALEHVYAEMARLCGLNMPRTQYFSLANGLAAFAIERFDRVGGFRVPMHTLAGALHANYQMPSVDYQNMLRMTRFMTRSETEVLKAFERCVYNVAFNNRDDHSKNFSYCLSEQGHWVLAPGYDLTFCEGPGGEHQMAVEGEGRTPGRPELLKLAKAGGVPVGAATAVIERVAESALRFDKVVREHPIRKATRRHVQDAISANLSRMR